MTFTTYCFEQFRSWNTLFPAEQGYFERLFTLFDKAPSAELDQLFEPMREAERKMGVTEKTWPRREFTLDQVDFLNRNPAYPQWRAAVAKVFASIDPILEREVARKGHPRVVIVIAPSQLPVGPDRLWTRLEGRGRRVNVEPPDDTRQFIPQLVGSLLKGRNASDAWAIETSNAIGSMGGAHLSYQGLERYRQRLMKAVNGIVESRDIRGPRQLSAKLALLKLLPEESALAGDPALGEFVRSTLLAGNGTLLINNTFVEWAAVQAIRRAKPSVLVASFGIRNKVKPFSSLLIYADQAETSPIPTQMDSLGSYVDLEVFYQYIWQECEKFAEYRTNTAYVFAAEGMDQLLLIAPPDFPAPAAVEPIPVAEMHRSLKQWAGS